jgi:hypothetical protein
MTTYRGWQKFEPKICTALIGSPAYWPIIGRLFRYADCVLVNRTRSRSDPLIRLGTEGRRWRNSHGSSSFLPKTLMQLSQIRSLHTVPNCGALHAHEASPLAPQPRIQRIGHVSKRNKIRPDNLVHEVSQDPHEPKRSPTDSESEPAHADSSHLRCLQ